MKMLLFYFLFFPIVECRGEALDFLDNGGHVKTGSARLRQPLFLLSVIAGKVKAAG